MSARIVLILIVALGCVYYFGVQTQKGKIGVGQPVPAFSLAQDDGSEIQSDSLRGHVVLINFWATYCQTCTKEMPALNRLASHFQGRPFTILGISEDGPPELAWQQIAEYKKKIPVTFPIVIDPHGHVADAYGTFLLPESYLVDTKGRLVRKVVGAVEWDHPSVIEEIERLLHGG